MTSRRYSAYIITEFSQEVNRKISLIEVTEEKRQYVSFVCCLGCGENGLTKERRELSSLRSWFALFGIGHGKDIPVGAMNGHCFSINAAGRGVQMFPLSHGTAKVDGGQGGALEVEDIVYAQGTVIKAG